MTLMTLLDYHSICSFDNTSVTSPSGLIIFYNLSPSLSLHAPFISNNLFSFVSRHLSRTNASNSSSRLISVCLDVKKSIFPSTLCLCPTNCLNSINPQISECTKNDCRKNNKCESKSNCENNDGNQANECGNKECVKNKKCMKTNKCIRKECISSNRCMNKNDCPSNGCIQITENTENEDNADFHEYNLIWNCSSTSSFLHSLDWICLSGLTDYRNSTVRISSAKASSLLSSAGCVHFIVTSFFSFHAVFAISSSLYEYSLLKSPLKKPKRISCVRVAPNNENFSKEFLKISKATSCENTKHGNYKNGTENEAATNANNSEAAHNSILMAHNLFNNDLLNDNIHDFDFGMRAGFYHNVARFLGDTPANLLTPALFCEYASLLSNNAGFTVKSFGPECIKLAGMDLFLSVTAGSAVEPRYLVVEYVGKKSSSNVNASSSQNTISNLKKSCPNNHSSSKHGNRIFVDKDVVFDVCVVAKGVTFDSGGISIKPSAGMAEMKADMLGAATSLCAVSLVAENKLPVNVRLEVPLCENMPGGKATKPGDVISGREVRDLAETEIKMSSDIDCVPKKGLDIYKNDTEMSSCSGEISDFVSVEIDNTDAEGRLILADALVHAQIRNPKAIIDIATLTGAMRIALGGAFSGIFTKSDAFGAEIVKAGIQAEDRVWRMPMGESYARDIESTVADIKNIGERGGAGSVYGAEFLAKFVKTEKWAHIDIASTMVKAEPREIYKKGVSGRGTMLLYQIMANMSEKNSNKHEL